MGDISLQICCRCSAWQQCLQFLVDSTERRGRCPSKTLEISTGMRHRLFRRLPETRKKAAGKVRGRMNYDSCRNLPAMFFEQAARLGDKPFLWTKSEGRYLPISWAEAARDVRRLALGLRSLGIGRGERVGLVSENRPEWVIADLAIMSAGAITVPAYVTHTIEDHRHVFSNSGARAVIVSKPPLSARVLAAANQVSTVHTVITIEPAAGQASAVDIRSWEEMLARGGEMADDTAELIAAIALDDLACLMHTSGTGGIPKGVMTSHRNILANCRGAYRLLEIVGLSDDVFLNFLPLSHTYEHTAGMMFPISLGAQIFFAEGAEALAANMLEVRPTIVTAVPRLYEILHRRIHLEAQRQGVVAKLLAGVVRRTASGPCPCSCTPSRNSRVSGHRPTLRHRWPWWRPFRRRTTPPSGRRRRAPAPRAGRPDRENAIAPRSARSGRTRAIC